LVNRYSKKLNWDEQRLSRAQVRVYANAVEQAGGVQGIWGFIDGTLRQICRPTHNQCNWYSGYKKYHAFKYQAIMTLDGLVSHLGRPFEGRLGDWAAWTETDIKSRLRQLH